MNTGTRKQQRRHKANPVAKHMEAFNKPKTHHDRKTKAKKGYVKHKGGQYDY